MMVMKLTNPFGRISAKIYMTSATGVTITGAQETIVWLPDIPFTGSLHSLVSLPEHEFQAHANVMHAIALSCNLLFSYFMYTAYTLVPQPQPHSLSTINATSSNIRINNATSLSLTVSNNDISCFDEVPGFLPINMPNYFAAVQQILLRDDALVSRPFYLGPSLESRWQWAGGATGDDHRCIVVLFNKKPLLTDAFPLIRIAQVAARIAEKCITVGRGYSGGWGSPGNGRGIVAVINAKSNTGRGEGGVSTERGLG